VRAVRFKRKVQFPKFQRLVQEAAVRLQAGRFEEAARLCAAARAAAPHDYAPFYVSGLVALQQGRAAEAAEWLLQARRWQPKFAPISMCLGLAWNALGRQSDAEAALRLAVSLAPDSAESWANLGAVLVTGNQVNTAIECLRRSLELNPRSASSWTGLGSALLLAGRGGEAIAAHNRAIELDPAHPKAFFSRAQALHACHRTKEALADFEMQLKRQPGHLEARSYRLLLLNYRDDVSAAALDEEHRAYGRAAAASVASRVTPALGNPADPDRKLRVAFLSPDLRQHSVAYFLEPLLRHMDPERFELWLYHDHYCVDAVSRRLKDWVPHWRNLVGLGADSAEAVIRADAPDILIDLVGHTGLNRLPLFARRLAPVQVSYLGYPNTTGLEAMDYRFTDEIADPVEADAIHTERLVRFAPTAWAYQAPADAPAVTPPPSTIDPGAGVTFGCFNSLSKVSDTTLHVWRELLAAVPGSRLVLKSAGLEAQVWEDRLEQLGFPLDRVDLLPRTATVAEHLACYARIDIALDPFPYHGTTTTCEALWMGRPVVTWCGDRHASRVGASLLTAIGQSGWIARSAGEYVQIAAALAHDRDTLARRSAELRASVSASPLGQHAGQAARFGAALRACWHEWCVSSAQLVAAAG